MFANGLQISAPGIQEQLVHSYAAAVWPRFFFVAPIDHGHRQIRADQRETARRSALSRCQRSAGISEKPDQFGLVRPVYIERAQGLGARWMSTSQLNEVIRRLRSAVLRPDVAGLPDGDLLKRYVQRRDELAFEALVRRHGPMVMGVCRRVLHHSHDAEDAFQATFLVLVRRASTLRSPSMVGNWLYGVAYRTALEAKKAAARRRAKETKVEPRTEVPRDAWADLRPVLDQELDQLPDKYRTVIVLCDLEGKTRKEAARELGWPEGTVASRLATARSMLAKRLGGYGLSVSGGVLATMLCRNASACVPASVMVSAIKVGSFFAARQAATGAMSVKITALADGVLKTMLLAKLKIAMVLVLAVACVAGGGLAFQTQAADDVPFVSEKAQRNEGVPDSDRAVRVAQSGPQRPDAGKGEKQPEKSDAEKLRGTWVAISGEVGGKQAPEAAVQSFKITFGDGKFTLERDGKSIEGTFKLNPAAKPKAIDTTVEGKTALAIYSLDGDKLKLCSDEDGTNRPTEFATKAGVRHVLLIFKREQAAAPDKGAGKGLKLTLSADKTETVMKADGSDALPVKLKLTFTNISDKPIKLNAYALPFRMEFRCTGPSPDTLQKLTVYVERAGLAPPVEKDAPLLQPGKSWSPSWTRSFPGDIEEGVGIVFSYTLRKPGTYKLGLTLYEAVMVGNEAQAKRTPWLESNELELKVRAKRDEEQGKNEADAGVGTLKVRGVLDEINAKNQTMTVTVPLKTLKGRSIRRGNDEEIIIVGRTSPTRLAYLPYAPDAVFFSGTKQVKGSDLRAGMHVNVQLNRSEATEIVVRRLEVVQARDDGFQDIEIEPETKGKS
jgi:RNA polymerase sigma factor (sigma-70 family)